MLSPIKRQVSLPQQQALHALTQLPAYKDLLAIIAANIELGHIQAGEMAMDEQCQFDRSELEASVLRTGKWMFMLDQIQTLCTDEKLQWTLSVEHTPYIK